MSTVSFLNVDISAISEIGSEPATVFTLMKFMAAKNANKKGWCELDYSYICSTLNIKYRKILDIKHKLCRCGFIELREGTNQHNRGQFRIIK